MTRVRVRDRGAAVVRNESYAAHMVRTDSRESWEHAAERLVGLLRDLLDNHWHAIEKALAKSMGKDQAAAHLRQLDHFTHALDAELWRKGGKPSRRIVGLLGSAAGLVLGSIATQAINLAMDDARRPAPALPARTAPPGAARRRGALTP